MLRTALLVVAVVLVVALLFAAVTTVVLVRRPLPGYGGEAEMEGLRGEVEIVRDALGIPQIYADDARDLFRAQGYVHAQDRFFDMDYRRRVASGRLAELTGRADDALASDAVARTLGWRRAAEEELDVLSPQTREYLEAYASGVNDYIDGREASRLALEYTVLGLTSDLGEIEPWSEVDSLVWLKALSWDLSRSFELELERSAVYQIVEDVNLVEELFPPYPEDRHATVIGPEDDGRVQRSEAGAVAPSGGAGAAVPSEPSGSAWRAGVPDVLAARAGEALVADVTAAVQAVPSIVGTGAGLGSNAWAVSGDRTASGAPLLAVDPHMAPSVPGVWYQGGLHCRTVSEECPFDVTGLGVAGVPGIFMGHNADVAWGLTSLPADVSDIFLERVFDNGTYLRDGQRVPLEERTEVLRVNGDDDVEVEVRRTAHGPILSDLLGTLGPAQNAPVPQDTPPTTLGGYAVAVASSALTPGRTLDGLLALATAGNAADVVAASALVAAPTFSIVYATTDGDVGYQAAGLVPRRATVAGSPVPSDGRWPRPGWDSRYDWRGFVPPEDLPGMVNPSGGYVVSTNQAVQASGRGPFLGREWDAGYRSERVGRLIEEWSEREMTVEAMQEIQLDVFNPNAALLVPYLLTVDVEDEFVQEGVDLLRGWDLEQSSDSAAAAYFAAVWANLLRQTFWDDMPEGYEPDGGSRWLEVVRRLLDDPQSSWWDDRTTINIVESRDEALIQALTNARLQLTVSLGKEPTRWSWSKVHEVHLAHPLLGAERFTGPVGSFVSPGPVPVDGGPSHVLATAWDAGRWDEDFPTFDVASAPVARLVVDLGDLDASTWVSLTGISGHPASSHYADQLGAWSDGRSYPWFSREEAVRESGVDTRILRPAE